MLDEQRFDERATMKKFAATRFIVTCLVFHLVALAPVNSAFAYVGPGLGGGVIAVALGVVGSVFLALFAVLWYPLKRLFKKRGNSPAATSQKQSADGTS